jgi:hypothetical protein
MLRDWSERSSLRKQSGYSKLEVEHRRHQTWRSIRDFSRSFWDETNVSRRLESVLRKRSREGEVERVQRAKEKIRERNIRVSRLSDSKGYSDLVKFWQKSEQLAYMGLRHPELRREGHSVEYYIGYQNGILSNIEDNRRFFEDAIFSIEKEVLEENKNKENKEKK